MIHVSTLGYSQELQHIYRKKIVPPLTINWDNAQPHLLMPYILHNQNNAIPETKKRKKTWTIGRTALWIGMVLYCEMLQKMIWAFTSLVNFAKIHFEDK